VDIQLEDNYGDYTDPITTAFYVVPTLGNEVIVGLPDILGNYFDHFSEFIYAARQDRLESSTPGVISRLDSICNRITEELSREEPRANHISKLRIAASQTSSSYLSRKRRILFLISQLECYMLVQLTVVQWN
jgi:hypothetical protein